MYRHNMILGLCMNKANGLNQDIDLAVEYYTQAAEQGHMSACLNLGIMYHFGVGVPQSPEREMKWFKAAAELGGVCRGCSMVGVMYGQGQGVEQDFAAAFRWYYKAALLGDMYAMGNIGYMYEQGEGVDADEAKAIEWMQHSAKAGYEPAQDWLSERGLDW